MPLYINRGFARKYNKAPILFADNHNDRFISATMHNVSIDGMHFVSDTFLKPGSDIRVALPDEEIQDKSPGIFICDTHRAQVVWCEKANSGTRFKVGVRFSKTPAQ